MPRYKIIEKIVPKWPTSWDGAGALWHPSSLFSHLHIPVAVTTITQVQGNMDPWSATQPLKPNYSTFTTQNPQTEALNIKPWTSAPFFFYLHYNLH